MAQFFENVDHREREQTAPVSLLLNPDSLNMNESNTGEGSSTGEHSLDQSAEESFSSDDRFFEKEAKYQIFLKQIAKLAIKTQ